MNKFTQFLFIFLIPLLVACNKADVPKSKNAQESILKIKQLNQLLLPTQAHLIEPIYFPFNDEYLMLRNHAYEELSEFAIKSTQFSNEELDYLKIQQRFPERYFPWPANIDVLSQLIHENKVQIKKAETWVKFVRTRLEEATNSNIKLNKLAHENLLKLTTRLITSLDQNLVKDNEVLALKSALISLNSFLLDYKPRNMLGLRQLPNGIDWYQSKLNYFLDGVRAPDEWLIAIQGQTKGLKQLKLPLVFNSMDVKQKQALLEHGFRLPEPMLAILITAFNDDLIYSKVSGLDWEQGYINYKDTFKKLYLSSKQSNDNFKCFWLTLAELDLGIHYQGWGVKQAEHVLSSRFQLNNEELTSLIEYLVLYPGQIMAGVKGLIEV